ncbi:hypothetical protein ACQY0O_005690 [Thecaphora frezii]
MGFGNRPSALTVKARLAREGGCHTDLRRMRCELTGGTQEGPMRKMHIRENKKGARRGKSGSKRQASSSQERKGERRQIRKKREPPRAGSGEGLKVTRGVT